MNLLLVGGAGHVGSLIIPYLKPSHHLRVLDLAAPVDKSVEWVAGSVLEVETVKSALTGIDAFLWLAMRDGQGGMLPDQDVPSILSNYDLNTKGLHLFLFLAQAAGVKCGVYTSSMSVHYRGRSYYPSEEAVPMDSPSVYGLTKGLGEEICQYFAHWFDMNLMSLRISGPRTRSQFVSQRNNPKVASDGSFVHPLDEEDMARAYLAAVDAVGVGHGRFDAVYITGDEAEREHNMSKARRLLGWSPRAQSLLDEVKVS